MCRLIKEKKWNELVPNACQDTRCERCDSILWMDTPISMMYAAEFFSPEQEEGIVRMYGHYTTTQWMGLFRYYLSSIPLLRFLFRTGRLSPDQSDPFTLLSHNVVWWNQENIDFLLSPEVGMNINLPTSLGNTALLQYLRSAYDEDQHPLSRPDPSDNMWTEQLQHLQFLLEHGADPLLGNRDGVTPLSYAERLTTFTAGQKEAVLSLLQRYA